MKITFRNCLISTEEYIIGITQVHQQFSDIAQEST